MFTNLKALMYKPKLYEKGTMELWTDEHISKGMLEAHLNPNTDAATRKHMTVKKTVNWIASVASPERYPVLLDLGCGPGVYTEEFHKAGYVVSGMDFSARSIDYAKNSAVEKGLSIKYHCQNYLTLDLAEEFDVITLIYYDFGVLSAEERAELLQRIHRALKPGGVLIFDVLKPHSFSDEESRNWEYMEEGFFSPEPHFLLNSFFRYDKESTILRQHIILSENNVECINVWEHMFAKSELENDLKKGGFCTCRFFGNIAGADYSENGKEMCIVAQK